MEWNVKNAINRDVERQHLNKILADIQATITKVEGDVSNIRPDQNTKDVVGQMVSGNTELGLDVTYDSAKKVLDFAVHEFTIRMVGDVTGEGTVAGLNSVTIDTSLSNGYITEAPVDGSAYWRKDADWEPVDPSIYDIVAMDTSGIVVRNVDAVDGDPTWFTRTLQVVPDELTVTDGDGIAADPTFGLADLVDSGVGTSPIQLFTRDAKGRIEGTEDADTGDLPEGSNLYFTDARARAAVITASISDGDTTHSPNGDVVFDALAGKEVAGAAASALVAANDFTTDEIAALSLVGTLFTPTLTNITNASSSTVGGSWYYMRIKDVVMMGGQLNVVPAASGTTVEVQASLPVASAFTNFSQASGSGSAANGTNLGVVGINASGANDTVRILFNPFATSTHNLFVQVIYRII